MSSVRDIIIIAVILFAVGISATFAVKIGHEVNANLLTITAINSTETAVDVIEHTDTAINMTDYIYLAFFIGFFFSIVIFGWLVGGSPIFAPIYFFMVVIFTFIAVILQLVWNDISTNADVVSTVAALPITDFILAHLGIFTAVLGLVGIVVMFAKGDSGGTTY